jgi:hypothetical protein
MAMNRTVCQYAIVRFMPFVETGEFANVGIIMMSAKGRYFGFKLQTNRHKRVTNFFDDLDAKIFRAAMADIKDELGRVRQLLMANGFDKRHTAIDTDFANTLFAEVVRPREVMVRFSQTRTALATDPDKTLDELFKHYVERDFVNKEYREVLMEKGIRNLLIDANLGERFVRRDIGNEEFHVPFPFVEMREGKPGKIIKALNLAQKEATKIKIHGNEWQFKIRQLKKKNFLPPEVLLTVYGPPSDDKRADAYIDAIEMLEETGVVVVPYDRKMEILRFAASQFS